MKRSEVNNVLLKAKHFFEKHHWHLPPDPKWDITDFGLGNFDKYGLVLVNLAEEKEYCEKLMYAQKDMITPCHTHKRKKEDIIVRIGKLAIQVWSGQPGRSGKFSFSIKLNAKFREVKQGEILNLGPGERVTLVPGIYHEFWPLSDECIIGEVSTANDDVNDNFFTNPKVGRFSAMEEDELPMVKLVSD